MKKSLILFFTAAISFLSVSCHDNIFELINSEVKLEKNGINGDGRVTRYHNSLVYCNGHIYYKTDKSSNDTGLFNKQWKKANHTPGDKIDYVPASTHFLASGNGVLFALTYTWYGNSSGVNAVNSKKIYYTTDEMSSSVNWKELTLPEELSGDTSVQVIFDNQAYNEADRKAFARIYNSSLKEYHIYKISD